MLLFKLFAAFFKIGLFTVGGGYAMIPFIEKEAVEINKWITHADFMEILAVDLVTPGPIAVNLATFVGYKVSGIPGAVIATLGVVLPSLIMVTAIAAFFYSFRESRMVQAILKGLKPAVIAFIAVALWRLMAGKAVIDLPGALIAVIVFMGVALIGVHPLWFAVFAVIAGAVIYY